MGFGIYRDFNCKISNSNNLKKAINICCIHFLVETTCCIHFMLCELGLSGGKDIEFKFVIVRKDKSLVWEDGENRVLNFPKGGCWKKYALLWAH